MCYHGISLNDEWEWSPELFVTPQVFRKRMELLKAGAFRVLPLGEAIERLYRSDLPPRSVVITFDDGFHNFAEAAFPVLKEYGFPATVYLTTYYSQRNLPVFPLLCAYLLWRGRHDVLEPNPRLGLRQAGDLRTAEGRAAALQAMFAYAAAQRLSTEGKDDLVQRLARHVRVDYGQVCGRRRFHLLSGDQVHNLSKNGVDFQLHTHRHGTPAEKSLYVKEIRENRHWIQERTHHKAVHFCYPGEHYQPRFVDWLREEGVRSAATCTAGMGSVRTNPFLLPRFLDHSVVSSHEFECWITGIGSLLHACRTALPGRGGIPRLTD